MATFEEFRSTFPESSNDKGESFEVFLSEWMFKHHPLLSSQFKKIWRFSEWPKAWSSTDIGTDLIAEDHHGKICAIQAKFYQETGTIPKTGIDSFLSDTNRAVVDYRLLIATTDRLSMNAINAIEGQEKPVQSFTLKDFLEPFEWPESLESLNKYQPREPHQPRPHQIAAIDDVSAKIESRGQLLMACGTGKTLTGQRIAEKLASKSTLVLLPSLLLLSKTVKDWVSEREQDFIFLPVCSDKSVTKQTDEIAVNDSELCFRSTTDALEIAEFLKRSENKVIFSTYQSSPQIAEAFRQHELKPFDLVIADEAHRCAGKVSSDYSTVLDESLLPSERRLFMTATPRTYKAHIRKKDRDNEIEIASMDDESTFGPVLHNLTFGQAIDNDPPLLTDYRVVVVGVNTESVKEMVEERTLVKMENSLEGDARSLAIQVGLAKAIKKYDLKRVITFHSRIKQAQNFAKGFTGFQKHLKLDQKPTGEITYEHVSGEMSTSERSKKLRALGALEDEDRYLLANARCLSEGVDVPALDGVAFVDPKRSETDIIQAVGRAIRLSEGKEKGTIVIPVFLSDSDDPDEVISTSAFDQVWKVVNALRSHDATLGEELDALRTKLGRKQKISLEGSKIVFDVHQQVGDEFIEAFETKLVETTTESWEFWYGLLQTYKEQHGHCRVPSVLKFNDVNLGQWVSKQRTAKDQMPPERLQRLDDLGFVWDAFTEKWEGGFAALQAYKEQHGHCRVPRGHPFKGVNLGKWVSKQRTAKDQMPPERIQRLDDLGFVWDVYAEQWEEGFAALQAYKEQHGHCRVPRGHPFKGVNLGHWVGTQRARKDQMTPERKQRLDDLGFVWDFLTEQWEESFTALQAYKEQHGDCRVPDGLKFKGVTLGRWVVTQRTSKDQMPSERIQQLDDLGFVWNPHTEQWEEGFTALQAYKEQHGDCRVPQRHPFKGVTLGRWVMTQRTSKDQMTPERKQRLDDLGFVWDFLTEQWEESFAALQAYKEQHGDCRVPSVLKFNGLNLGVWINNQRKAKDEMPSERKQRLDDLGFVWDFLTEQWEESFTALQAYKEQHGDCRVPQGLKFNGFNLGRWVSVQRMKKDQMTPERKQRLDDLGFIWDARGKRNSPD